MLRKVLIVHGLHFSGETTSNESFPLEAHIRGRTATKLSLGPFATSAQSIQVEGEQPLGFAGSYLDQAELKDVQICARELTAISVAGSSIARAEALSNGHVVKGDVREIEGDVEGRSDLQISAHDPIATASFANLDASHFAFRPLEVHAWGKWQFDETTNQLTFLHRNYVEPAMRSSPDPTGTLHDGDFVLVASARALFSSKVALRLANRTESARKLKMRLVAKVLGNANDSRLIEPYHMLKLLQVVRDDGPPVTIPVVWGGQMAEVVKDIGTIGSGEALTINVANEFEGSSSDIHEAGAATEDVAMEFFLEP